VNNVIAANSGLPIDIVKRSDDTKASSSRPADGLSSAPFPGSVATGLNKDFENLADTLLAFATLAAIQLGDQAPCSRNRLLSSMMLGAGDSPTPWI
jgi:hypothetical protein